MTKMKKFLALLASLTAVATLGLATACGDKGDSSTPAGSTPPASTPGDSTPDDSTPVEKTYTVTVKKPDGTPAAGYWLQTCVGDNCSTPAQTDANGVFTFAFEDDATVYHVQATNGGGDDYANYEVVDFNTVPGTLAYEITLVEKAPAVVSNTVAEVYAGENDAEFVLTGTVLANSGKGYVLADATGSLFIYGTTDANVGDIVKVTGTRATFGNCVQLKPTAVEAAEGTAIQADAIKELTAADCDAYKAAENMVPEYASFVGTLSVSNGKYFNIAMEGTEVIGSIVTPTDADKALLAELNGKVIKVEGYVVYVSSGKYLYSVATNISEVVVEESITISEPLSGTGAYDDITWEYDYFQIEAGKYYKASKEAQSATYSSIGYTLTSSVNGTYTLHIPESENENPVVVTVDGVVAELTDGSSFAVEANTPVNVWVISYTEDPETFESIYFDAVFGLTFDANTYEPDGSALAPIGLVSGTTYEVESWKEATYYFTAPSAGQYKLTLSDWAAQSEGFSFFDAEYNTINRGVAIDIAEGETVMFTASSYLDNAASWTFTFGAALENDENFDAPVDEDALGTENNPLSIEAVGDYEITLTAGTDFYAQFFGGAFQFVVPEGVTVFTLGMSSGMYSAGQTVAFTDYAKWNNTMYFTITAEADTTVTLSVTEYVVPVALIAGENMIYVSEDALATGGVLCTFTAYVTGQYTFASNDVGARVFDSNDMMVGLGMVNLTAGETYKVLVFAAAAGEYTLTVEVPEATGGEDGGEDGGEVADDVLVLDVAKKIQITAENIDEAHGVSLYFTPDTYGIYQFKGDLGTAVYDNDTLEPVAKVSGRYTLQAGKTYWVIVYNFMPSMIKPGEYTITAQLKEVLSEGGDEEVEANGSEAAPFVIEDLFAAPIVTKTGIYDSDMVWYTFTLTESKTLVFTFDNADSWFRVKNESGSILVSGYSTETYEGTLAAGTYLMGIASWDVPNDALSLTITEKATAGGDAVVGGTYLSAKHSSGRYLQVIIDATAGTMTLTRSDLAGSLTSGGAQVASYTIELNGADTVATNVSGQVCTFVWNADGTPASITWGSATFEGFTLQA